MVRMRYLVAALSIAAGIGAGAAWAAGGGTTTSPGSTTPSTATSTTPSTSPSTPHTGHCPHMGTGSGSSDSNGTFMPSAANL
jgi:hypothetical protein